MGEAPNSDVQDGREMVAEMKVEENDHEKYHKNTKIGENGKES